MTERSKLILIPLPDDPPLDWLSKTTCIEVQVGILSAIREKYTTTTLKMTHEIHSENEDTEETQNVQNDTFRRRLSTRMFELLTIDALKFNIKFFHYF